MFSYLKLQHYIQCMLGLDIFITHLPPQQNLRFSSLDLLHPSMKIKLLI